MNFGKESCAGSQILSTNSRPQEFAGLSLTLALIRINSFQSMRKSKTDPAELVSKQEQLRTYYETLHRAWGPQHWWPARTRFEVIVGAYLTQNTSWTNVEIAIRRLREAGVLTLTGVRRTPLPNLEALIRPSGYFRQKAARLKIFVAFVDDRYGGSLNRMFAQSTKKLRQELLELNGIGPETADSILLYAGQHPVFVVDAYTRRILERHEIVSANASHEEIRTLFENALGASPESTGPRLVSIVAANSRPAHPPSAMSLAKRSTVAQIYNDMHGLIVSLGKRYCLKSKPRCEECPLRQFLPKAVE
jgi:endonuclease III related protein